MDNITLMIIGMIFLSGISIWRARDIKKTTLRLGSFVLEVVSSSNIKSVTNKEKDMKNIE
jgi:hypothetical protein